MASWRRQHFTEPQRDGVGCKLWGSSWLPAEEACEAGVGAGTRGAQVRSQAAVCAQDVSGRDRRDCGRMVDIATCPW